LRIEHTQIHKTSSTKTLQKNPKGNTMAQFLKLTGTAVGAETQQLRDFAKFLTEKALTDIKTALDTVDTKINQTTWSGTDANTFSADWEKQKAETMAKITSMLQDTAQRANTQAQNQDEVSRA
jgi:hypothetical protein